MRAWTAGLGLMLGAACLGDGDKGGEGSAGEVDVDVDTDTDADADTDTDTDADTDVDYPYTSFEGTLTGYMGLLYPDGTEEELCTLIWESKDEVPRGDCPDCDFAFQLTWRPVSATAGCPIPTMTMSYGYDGDATDENILYYYASSSRWGHRYEGAFGGTALTWEEYSDAESTWDETVLQISDFRGTVIVAP